MCCVCYVRPLSRVAAPLGFFFFCVWFLVFGPLSSVLRRREQVIEFVLTVRNFLLFFASSASSASFFFFSFFFFFLKKKDCNSSIPGCFRVNVIVTGRSASNNRERKGEESHPEISPPLTFYFLQTQADRMAEESLNNPAENPKYC